MTIDRKVLDTAAADPRSPAWELIWKDLHRLDAGNPSLVALLPWLARTCAAFDRKNREEVLGLAGVIAAAADATSRAFYINEVTALRELARDCLATGGSNEYGFVNLQTAVLRLAGDPIWSTVLSLINGGQAQVQCPACAEELLLCLEPGESSIEQGLFSELAERLHAEAMQAGRESVAASLMKLFGRFSCPQCSSTFNIADQVADGAVE